MHPLGFAYYPDGAHDNKDELEPIINASLSICATTFSCPTPNYYLNNEYLGELGTANFGLDDYEPKFTRDIVDWTEFGNFSVQLNFDDTIYQQDIFYFCHVSYVSFVFLCFLSLLAVVTLSNLTSLPLFIFFVSNIYTTLTLLDSSVYEWTY